MEMNLMSAAASSSASMAWMEAKDIVGRK